MCGEHLAAAANGLHTVGSSPHVRGTPAAETDGERLAGIIPACAGNTGSTSQRSPATRDHPRMCGEHCLRRRPAYHRTGSSPHVRGTLPRSASGLLETGIIPACAGNTAPTASANRTFGDHPRMCGEHLIYRENVGWYEGSSPHVRGTLVWVRVCRAVVGIIPACAGNTAAQLMPSVNCGDHPRMCGEHGAVTFIITYEMGSSPHVRGTRVTVC